MSRKIPLEKILSDWLTLEQWQTYANEFKRENPQVKPAFAFRVDGTQFSVGAYYGGFTYNGDKYTCFYFPSINNAEAIIGVREDFLKWVKNRIMKDVSKDDITQTRFNEIQLELFT